jgi:hypothetical protein
MEEQFQNQAAPAKPKGGMLKMIIVNVIISALVSAIVSVAVVSAVISPLEKQLTKINSFYHVGK